MIHFKSIVFTKFGFELSHGYQIFEFSRYALLTTTPHFYSFL